MCVPAPCSGDCLQRCAHEAPLARCARLADTLDAYRGLTGVPRAAAHRGTCKRHSPQSTRYEPASKKYTKCLFLAAHGMPMMLLHLRREALLRAPEAFCSPCKTHARHLRRVPQWHHVKK